MRKPVVIIGGGLAGLYAAYNLKKRDIPFLLLEAKASLGGRIASHYLPSSIRPRRYLNSFRGEPAISEFDWPFTPSHKSSANFSTLVGSVLQ